jgi:hypothetical protein
MLCHLPYSMGAPPSSPQARMQCSFLPQGWYFYIFKEPRNRFEGIDFANLCSLSPNFFAELIPGLLKRLQIHALAGHDKPIPTQFLAPIDCSKLPAPFPSQDLEPEFQSLNLAG